MTQRINNKHNKIVT